MANPEKDQDRVFDTFDHYRKFGFVMFPQNLQTYRFLKKELTGNFSVLEAGCGMGLGSNIIKPTLATDKLVENIKFARALYPDILFDTWDIGAGPFPNEFDTVVCVEAIEHAADPVQAIENLIASARVDVWFSTPNNSEETPSNPFHTREYSLAEMREILKGYKYTVHRWDTFDEVTGDSDISPLIYHILL